MNTFIKLNLVTNLKKYESFYVYIVLLSYFFLWDITYQQISFKYSIFITFFFIFFKKVKLKQLKYSFYILFFLISHLFINKFFFDLTLTSDNAKGIILIFTSFIFVTLFRDQIFEKLHTLYTYFPVIFIPFSLFNLKHDSIYFEKLDFKCSYLMYSSQNFKKVFLENSHFGMILPSLLIYNLYILLLI